LLLPPKRLRWTTSEGIEMADETKSLKIKEINEVLSDFKMQNLKGVVLEGDIEIEIELSRRQPLQDLTFYFVTV
jgi:hypothetical protein